MAKKIRLDFSKVEERSGWKTDHMPEGLHEFKVELVDDKDAGDGTEMYTYGLRPTDPRYKTRLFPYYCKQQANQYFKFRDLHIAAGVLDPKRAKGKAVDIIVEAPVGKLIAAEVVDSRNPQYQGRSEIDGVYDKSIIDDDDRVAANEDDEEYEGEEAEDEYEEEEYEEEYEDEAEESDEDDRAEELEGLTLAQLRKEAKGLEIDTAGLKKADLIEAILEAEEEADEDDEDEDDLDEDDLDDEELAEEEFEDDEDEEEEAPAPRKRPAAKKPAAKAPAKKAAAPARRTIKRR